MKYLLLIQLSILLLVCTCCKDEDEFCIMTSTWETPILRLSQSDITNIQNIFDSNQLTYNNLQFRDITETDSHYRVGCYQFYNGLKIFTEPLGYYFNKSKTFEFIIGDTISHKSIVLGNTPKLDIISVFNTYKSTIESDSKITWNGSICYSIELGYYNIKVSSTSSSSEREYVLSWRINPENGSVPLVYINDDTTEVIYYDNGIRN